MTSPTHDRRALVAIDLGAESCRVSLLRWHDDEDGTRSPEIQLIHRLPNGPTFNPEEGPNGTLRWPLDRILAGLSEGLLRAAQAAPEGIRSIAVDGWAVDYVRLNSEGSPIEQPFCYRDVRSEAAKPVVESLVAPEDQFLQTGAQPLRINTVYQLMADKLAGGDPTTPWLLLPEYVLSWLGARRVAEYTNATHTGLVSIETQDWSPALFRKLGLSIEAAPPIVRSGAGLGKMTGHLALIPAFADTDLMAPACHDTASAIAAVTADLSHTAYIVSGTWSLIGTVIDQPITSLQAMKEGFTNQGEATGGYCFHTNVNGMWIFKQCLDHWAETGRMVDMASLITAAAQIKAIPGIINVDAPSLMLAGRMPERINQELSAEGKPTIPDEPGNEAIFARLIFASLAIRYAKVIDSLAALTGRSFQKITILGGGSRNKLLSALTEHSTGLPVSAGEAEGSTLGNFAVQLAAHENPDQPLSPERVRAWAKTLLQPVPSSG